MTWSQPIAWIMCLPLQSHSWYLQTLGQEHKWRPMSHKCKYLKVLNQADKLLNRICAILSWHWFHHNDLEGQLWVKYSHSSPLALALSRSHFLFSPLGPSYTTRGLAVMEMQNSSFSATMNSHCFVIFWACGYTHWCHSWPLEEGNEANTGHGGRCRQGIPWSCVPRIWHTL